MAKSMHALCRRVTLVSQAQIPQNSHPGGLSVRCLGEEDSVGEEARTGQAEVKVQKKLFGQSYRWDVTLNENTEPEGSVPYGKDLMVIIDYGGLLHSTWLR